MKPFSGSIVGVWTTEIDGKPRVLLESEDGRTYMLKCKEVWPGHKVEESNGDERDTGTEGQDLREVH